MNKKFIWLIVSCLMVAALVLASCAPAVVEEKKATVVTKEPEKKVGEVEKVVEKVGPQYGGILIPVGGAGAFHPASVWDPIEYSHFAQAYGSLIYEHLGMGDWSRGPAGTGENPFIHKGFYDFAKYGTGMLAESWEMADPLTLIVNIRPGVLWQNKPPVNGREMTADDVVFSYERHQQEKTVWPCSWAPYVQSITATGKYTVVFKLLQPYVLAVDDIIFGETYIHPPEVIQTYGDLRDWRNAQGTGPFMLTDVLPDTVVVYKRNPSYWGYDELNPENRLPYVDEVRWLQITDNSTQLAALRTGKIDIKLGVGVDEAESLKVISPHLMMCEQPDSDLAPGTCWRVDIPPFNDLRVRRAMYLAIDFQEIVDDYYDGNAKIIGFPALPLWPGFYVRVEDLPPDVREDFSYNPEKAKQLLKEADYPNGFTADFVMSSKWPDEGPILLEYWKAIGLNLEFQLKEHAAAVAIRNGKDYEGLVAVGYSVSNPYNALRRLTTGNRKNFFNASDLVYDAMVEEVLQTMDPTERMEKYREAAIYQISQHWGLPWLVQYGYNFWQPWVKNYHGELALSYCGFGDIYARVWIDQELKKEMVGR